MLGAVLALAAMTPVLDPLSALVARSEVRRQLDAWQAEEGRLELGYQLSEEGLRDSLLQLWPVTGKGPVLDLRLAHRGLDSELAGRFAYQAPDGARVLRGRLLGRVRYRPWSALLWSLQLEGEPVSAPQRRIAPWSASLQGDAAGWRLDLSLPRVGILDDGVEIGSLHHLRIRASLRPGARPAAGSATWLGASLQSESGEYRAPTGRVSLGAIKAELGVDDGDDEWPVRLDLHAVDLVHPGLPFGRAERLSLASKGLLHPLRDGLMWWQGESELQGQTNYGPLQGRAVSQGTGAWDGFALGRMDLEGVLPPGLWGLARRLLPGLPQGMARQDGLKTRLRLSYRDGAWYLPDPSPARATGTTGEP